MARTVREPLYATQVAPLPMVSKMVFAVVFVSTTTLFVLLAGSIFIGFGVLVLLGSALFAGFGYMLRPRRLEICRTGYASSIRL